VLPSCGPTIKCKRNKNNNQGTREKSTHALLLITTLASYYISCTCKNVG